MDRRGHGDRWQDEVAPLEDRGARWGGGDQGPPAYLHRAGDEVSAYDDGAATREDDRDRRAVGDRNRHTELQGGVPSPFEGVLGYSEETPASLRQVDRGRRPAAPGPPSADNAGRGRSAAWPRMGEPPSALLEEFSDEGQPGRRLMGGAAVRPRLFAAGLPKESPSAGHTERDARTAARRGREDLTSSAAGLAFSSPAADDRRSALAGRRFNSSVASVASGRATSGPSLDRRIEEAFASGEFEDCPSSDTERAYHRRPSKYDGWTPAQREAEQQASQRRRFLLWEERRNADHAAARRPVLPPPPSAASAARTLRVEARRGKPAHGRMAEPELVSLFEYFGEEEDICGGRVSSARYRGTHLVCSVRPDLCRHKHANKCHQLLRPGFYVGSAKGDSFFQEHFVSHTAAAASKNFEAYRGARIPLAQMISLVRSSATGGDVVLADVKRFVAYAASPAAGTPCPARPHRPAKTEAGVGPPDPRDLAGGADPARPNLGGEEPAMPAPDEEAALDAAADRLAALEGNVGARGESSGPATLWESARLSDERISAAEEYAALVGEAQGATQALATQAHAAADKAERVVTQFVATGGSAASHDSLLRELEEQRRVVAAQGRELLKMQARHSEEMASLRALVSGVSDIATGIAAGRVRIAGSPGEAVAGGPFVSLATFNSERALASYERELLGQRIDGGGITLGGETFTVLEDVRTFAASSLPAGMEVYECFVGMVAALQCIKEPVVSTKTVQAAELHEIKVQRSQRQSGTVASFATTVPELFGATSLSSLVTFLSFDAGNGKTGIVHVVTKGLKAELGALTSHVKVVLAAWPVAAKLANDVFEETRAFVQ